MHASALVQPDPLAPPSVPGWSNEGGQPTAIALDEGSYEVTFPGLALNRGHVVANVFGTPPQYCTVAAWWPSGVDEVIRVDCYDAASHGPTDVFAFTIAVTK